MNKEKIYEMIFLAQEGNAVQSEQIFEQIIEDKVANRLEDLQKEVFSESSKQPADEDAAHELHLYATNDHHLYRGHAQVIIKNLKKKVNKGTYDHEKATKLWRYHADAAAQKYKKEIDSHTHFSPATRDLAAKHLRDHYDESVRGVHAGIRESIYRNAEEMNLNLSEEQLDEISKKTLGSYIKKASTNAADKNYIAGHRYGQLAGKGLKYDADNHANDLMDRSYKRKKNINKAVDKLTGQAKVNANENVDNSLEELSKSTLSSYQDKASKEAARLSFTKNPSDEVKRKFRKRVRGMAKSQKMIDAKESVEEGKNFSGVKDDKSKFHAFGETVVPHKIGQKVKYHGGKEGSITSISLPEHNKDHKNAEFETVKYRVISHNGPTQWVNHGSIESAKD